MSVPTISVAIPAYQASRWIAETLDAVLAQASPADEVIVVDDGSTDGTAELAEAYGPPVRVVRQANRGAAGAYNRGFQEATGDFVAKCPADDLWVPEKLAWQREALARHPQADVLFGLARDFGVVEGDLPGPPGEGLLDNATLLPALYRANCFAAPSALVRRSLHARLGGFREDLRIGEDYDFWLRAVEAGARLYYDPRLLVRLRKHGGNLSMQALATWELNHRIHEAHADAVGDPALVRRTLSDDLTRIGRCRLGLGRAREAREAYRASLRARPTAAALAATAALSLRRRRARPPAAPRRGGGRVIGQRQARGGVIRTMSSSRRYP
ncbi:MAG: glycosyltransferase [Thermoleophilia bacterium]